VCSSDLAELSQELRNLLVEVRVRDTMALPDSATIRTTDPKGENVDELMTKFKIGKQVEIKTGAIGDRSMTSIFKGDVVAFEPEFGKSGVDFVVRALDRGHKLQRERKVRTFQQMSASDIVKKIAGESGLSPQVQSTSVVHEFFQQSAETDWDLIARLARMHGYRFYVEDTKLCFKPFAADAGAAVGLRWQDSLMSFRPRVSGIQQVQTVNVRSWDPKKKANVTGTSASGVTKNALGIQRSAVVNDSGRGTTLIADRLAATSSEANEIAKSALNGRAESFTEAEGVAFGNPKIKAGGKVQVSGVGRQFSGTYTVTSSTHSYRGATGYQTSFQISGRSSRTLLELMRPPKERDWSSSLVVGVVTNNNDPEQMGRVRVKYPSLSDSEESAWARVATPSAGKARGLLMLPQPDEEVIIGFEHGDTRRPIVVGSVFNGKDKPGEELMQNRDGSFALVSNEKIHQHSKKDFEITSDQNMVVEIKQDEKHTVKGSYTHETTGTGKLKAQQYTVEAGSSMTVKGVSVTVEASAALTLKGATVDIQGSGPVNIKGAIINIG